MDNCCCRNKREVTLWLLMSLLLLLLLLLLLFFIAAVVAAVVAAPSRSQILIFASSVFRVDLSNYTLAEFSACFHESKPVCTTKKNKSISMPSTTHQLQQQQLQLQLLLEPSGARLSATVYFILSTLVGQQRQQHAY